MTTTHDEAGKNFQEQEREHRTAEDAMRDDLYKQARGEEAHVASLEGLLVESKAALDGARAEIAKLRAALERAGQ